jgi:hypothetical protein
LITTAAFSSKRIIIPFSRRMPFFVLTTMKNQIGGTKSLSSRAYNQQFAGTLKKIRHLFNISPSFLIHIFFQKEHGFD